MAKRIEGLGEKMKDKLKFDKLPPKIKMSVYMFLTANRKIRRLDRLEMNLKDEFKRELEKIQKLKSQQIAIESLHYKSIKNLPNNFYTISQIYVNKEKNKNSYIIDFIWCGIRKKFSLGTNLKEINIICKRLNKDLKTDLNEKNYKNLIIESFKFKLNDFLLKNGSEKFEEQSLFFDKVKLKFKYIKEHAKVDITKPIRNRNKVIVGKNAFTPTKVRRASYNDMKTKRYPIPTLNINPD